MPTTTLNYRLQWVGTTKKHVIGTLVTAMWGRQKSVLLLRRSVCVHKGGSKTL